MDAVISESVVDAKPFRRMEIKCRKKFKLLTYVEASRENISRFMESS